MGNIQKTVDELRPIDDTLGQKLAEHRAFCQEMMQVMLENPNLRLVSNIPQKDIHNIDTRSVTVDMLCEDEMGAQLSAEMQIADNDDHQKRVRYNSSCVQILSLKKGAKFKELPDAYMVYITEKDFLKKGKTIYHIDRTIHETGEMIDNGYHEIYVNAEVDDGSLIAEYMKLLTSPEVHDNEKFPHICDVVRYYKKGKGRAQVCKIVEEYAKEYAEEYAKETALQTAMSLIRDGVSDAIIQNATKLSPEVIAGLRRNC